MSADWDRQVDNEVPRYRSRLGSVGYQDDNPDLKIIIDAVLHSAAERSLNAGYSGSHDDGGASSSVDKLKHFLTGYAFGKGGDAGDYQKILDEHARDKDPQYQEYLKLKKKFEK
jgi:hypothetical protein